MKISSKVPGLVLKHMEIQTNGKPHTNESALKTAFREVERAFASQVQNTPGVKFHLVLTVDRDE